MPTSPCRTEAVLTHHEMGTPSNDSRKIAVELETAIVSVV